MEKILSVVDYNPQWNELFKTEAKYLKQTFGKNIRGIYHVGGTAIKGMCARPIIDIVIAVKSGTLDQIPYEILSSSGYECVESCRFFKNAGEFAYQVLVFEETNVKELRRYMAMAGYLTAKKDEMKYYNEMKNALAKQYPESPEEYEVQKKQILDQLEVKAMEWQDKQEELGKHMSMGMCIGTAIGCGVGYLLFDMIIGMAIGMGIGLTFGYLYGRKKVGE